MQSMKTFSNDNWWHAILKVLCGFFCWFLDDGRQSLSGHIVQEERTSYLSYSLNLGGNCFFYL